MGMPRVAIVGYGAVGRAIHELFPEAVAYDEPLGIGSRDEIDGCDVAFSAVPTPSGDDGRCDVSIVEDTVSWIGCDYIVIRSTVEVGTTARLREQTGKHIVFQPEYGPAETPDHPFKDLRDVRWAILGGDRDDTRWVANLYQRIFDSTIVIHQTSSETAELCKYMENAYLATNVAFSNEFYDLAETAGVDYHELRELWLLDPRINRSHTWVYPDDRGFGGRCLPKDLEALTSFAKSQGQYPAVLLNAVRESNAEVRDRKRD